MKYLLFFIILLDTACNKPKANQQTLQGDFIQEKITDHLYVLKSPNYNTNTGVFIGENELLLVDPMSGINNHQNLLQAIRQLSEKPIKYILNTHSHPDHSGANAFFAELGATIISHENAKYSQAKHALTFNDTFTLDMGNETIELLHITAHTFDDALIYFKNSNAVFMGDTFMTNSFPHFYYGGGSEGHIEILDKALSLGNPKTTIISAHGHLSSNKNDLTVYKENSQNWINRITELHEANKTPEEIANDQQIIHLSTIFNDGKNALSQSIIRTINKTISVDLISDVPISKNKLKHYEGLYQYENGQVDEIILEQGKLILRSEGAYIFEIVPLSQTQFHLKGQFPSKHLTFNMAKNSFVYFNGKERLTANRK
ncbi:MBL fold metallo-hydrolase [Roseivirga sp.]|uniref:MBL fold metallo-hydrolase n=1 Tax=Roseivirga sp. TaxID=1964215 RepID=UPI002B2772AB|nr:MBL fold metallo-hydrolase [Roseivirga sp.]